MKFECPSTTFRALKLSTPFSRENLASGTVDDVRTFYLNSKEYFFISRYTVSNFSLVIKKEKARYSGHLNSK